jgi:hypothetical protein
VSGVLGERMDEAAAQALARGYRPGLALVAGQEGAS